jgi:hypothetical protein
MSASLPFLSLQRLSESFRTPPRAVRLDFQRPLSQGLNTSMPRGRSMAQPIIETRRFLKLGENFPGEFIFFHAIRTSLRSQVEHNPQPCPFPFRIFASSQLKQIHPHGWNARRRLCGLPKMREDALDRSGRFGSREEPESPVRQAQRVRQ